MSFNDSDYSKAYDRSWFTRDYLHWQASGSAYGLTENDGHENDGPSKLQDMKLQDMKKRTKWQDMKMQVMKLRDQIAGHENAGT